MTRHKSVWQEVGLELFPKMPGDQRADAAIVGAGLCGLLCAYCLLERGMEPSRIVMIDAERVCSGATAMTTAKLTSQHGLIYDRLLRGLGEELARQYAQANQTAVEKFRAVVAAEGIDCELADVDSYVYTVRKDACGRLAREVTAACSLGLPARFVRHTELPFSVAGAVQLANQAQLHPLKLARGILSILRERGCRIYENTKAVSLEDGAVFTDQGKIFAQSVILSTRFPFADKRGLFSVQLYQERSYVVALKNAQRLHGTYLDCDKPGLSLRGWNDGREDLVLLGGEQHKTGHDPSVSHYSELIERAVDLYPECTVCARWSSQDCMTHDGIPYIGRSGALGERVFLATGFNKWGMTSSMAAGMILSDLIDRGESEYSDVFSPARPRRLQGGSLVRESVDAAAGYVKKVFFPAPSDVRRIAPGQGEIVDCAGRKLGVFRDEKGELHAVDPTCTHLFCGLEFNRDEKSWDCRCHGSRFDIDGNPICGPAMTALDAYRIEPPSEESADGE